MFFRIGWFRRDGHGKGQSNILYNSLDQAKQTAHNANLACPEVAHFVQLVSTSDKKPKADPTT